MASWPWTNRALSRRAMILCSTSTALIPSSCTTPWPRFLQLPARASRPVCLRPAHSVDGLGGKALLDNLPRRKPPFRPCPSGSGRRACPIWKNWPRRFGSAKRLLEQTKPISRRRCIASSRTSAPLMPVRPSGMRRHCPRSARSFLRHQPKKHMWPYSQTVPSPFPHPSRQLAQIMHLSCVFLRKNTHWTARQPPVRPKNQASREWPICRIPGRPPCPLLLPPKRNKRISRIIRHAPSGR